MAIVATAALAALAFSPRETHSCTLVAKAAVLLHDFDLTPIIRITLETMDHIPTCEQAY